MFTIGHSTRGFEEFCRVLKKYGVELLVDVRRFPSSKNYPHFNREFLEKELEKMGVEYIFLGNELGGYREGGYGEFSKTEEFRKAVDELIETGKGKNACIMCAEWNPHACHRKYIAQALAERGIPVIHIIDEKSAYGSLMEIPKPKGRKGRAICERVSKG